MTPSDLSPLEAVAAYVRRYSTQWRGRDDGYWLARLMEEVGEVAATVSSDHPGPLHHELKQVASICINWLTRLREDQAGAGRSAERGNAGPPGRSEPGQGREASSTPPLGVSDAAPSGPSPLEAAKAEQVEWWQVQDPHEDFNSRVDGSTRAVLRAYLEAYIMLQESLAAGKFDGPATLAGIRHEGAVHMLREVTDDE